MDLLRPLLRCAALAGWLAALLAALLAEGARADSFYRPVQRGSIVYLPMVFDARVERYDLATQSFLPPLALPAVSHGLAVGSDALYALGHDAKLRRVTFAGIEVWSVPLAADQIVLDPAGRVFAVSREAHSLYSFDAATGALLDSEDLGFELRGLSIAPGLRRLYVEEALPSEIRVLSVPYAESGAFASVLTAPEVFPSGSGADQTWVFPNEDRIADEHGVVFDAQTLERVDYLLGSLDDLAFHGDDPIRFDGGEIARFGPGLELLGTSFTEYAEAYFAWGDDAFAFDGEGAPARVRRYALADLTFPPPAPPVDSSVVPTYAVGLGLDTSGVLQLLARDVPQLLRWSVPLQRFLPNVVLRRMPSLAVRCPALGGLLLAYRGGDLRVLPDGATEEQHWRNFFGQPDALVCTDRYVVAVSGAFTLRGALTSYDADGEPVDSADAPRAGRQLAWWAAQSRIFLAEYQTSGPALWDLVSYVVGDDGRLHPERRARNAEAFDDALWAPDGTNRLVTSAGNVFDAETLADLGNLGWTRSAVWFDGKLRTVEGATQGNLLTWTAGL